MDAFVALGGQPDIEGCVSKENLIEIIKAEFELTIDMEDFLRKIGGNSEEINYYQKEVRDSFQIYGLLITKKLKDVRYGI